MTGRVKLNSWLASPSSATEGPIHPLQTIVNELSQILDYQQIVGSPLNNEHLAMAFRKMSDVTLEDLGLQGDSVSYARRPLCLTIVDHPSFHVAAFVLPKKFHMSLHDHPNMAVCTKLLAGKIQLRSFTGHKRGGEIIATVALEDTKTHLNNPWLLTAELGNFHEITALEDTVMLDLIIPPYNDVSRVCTFYRAVPLPGGGSEVGADKPLYKLKPLNGLDLAKVVVPNSAEYKGFSPTWV